MRNQNSEFDAAEPAKGISISSAVSGSKRNAHPERNVKVGKDGVSEEAREGLRIPDDPKSRSHE